MSLTKAIAKNTIIQIGGKTISTLLGLVAVAIMTRSLGVEKFGWYITATGFLQFIGILSDFGFTVTTANMLSEPHFEKQKLLNNLFTWRFITAFVFQLIGPAAILFFPYPDPVKIAVAIMAVSFFCISLNNIFIGYYQANLKMIVQMTGEILSRVVLVIGLFFVSAGKFGFLPAMSVVTLASIAYTSYLFYKSPEVKFEYDKTISKAIFKKIWPTAITVIFNAFYLQGDRVILPLYATQTDVGLYGAAYRVLDIVTQSIAMIMGIMMPLIAFAWSRTMAEEFKKRCQTSFDLVALIVMPMMTGIIVLSTPIMNLVAGKEFTGSGGILKLLAIAIFGLAFGNIFGYINLAITRQRQAMWVYISDAVLTTAAYFILIPKYGMYGAAWATIFSELYAGFLLMLLAGFYSKFWPKLKAFGKIILASLVMGGFIFWLQPLNIIISILLGVAIYGACVLLFKIVSKETLLEILRPSNKSV